MNRLIVILWILAALLSTGVLLHAVGTFGTASSQRRGAEQALSHLQEQARLLNTLRGQLPSWATETPVDSNLLASRVSDTLAAANISTASLAALAPEAETTVASSGTVLAKRRRATLTLSPISLSQLGRFLDRWRQSGSGWTVANLDLLPPTVKHDAAKPGDVPLRVIVVLESTLLHDTGAAP